MAKKTKRWKQTLDKLEDKKYAAEEAVKLLKDLPPVKFSASMEVAVMLGVDARKSDQLVRGATVLPHGSGKTQRIAVMADGEQAQEARAAGADIVGLEDLEQAIRGGEINFDVLIATPATMKTVGKLGQILGPKGLMPNPKLGTVTNNLTSAIGEVKKGKLTYRTDKNGIIHGSIGSLVFENAALLDNLQALLSDLKKLKPASSKGTYIKKVVLSSTMGPGLVVDRASLGVV